MEYPFLLHELHQSLAQNSQKTLHPAYQGLVKHTLKAVHYGQERYHTGKAWNHTLQQTDAPSLSWPHLSLAPLHNPHTPCQYLVLDQCQVVVLLQVTIKQTWVHKSKVYYKSVLLILQSNTHPHACMHTHTHRMSQKDVYTSEYSIWTSLSVSVYCVYQLNLKWPPLKTCHLYILTHNSSTQNGRPSSRFPATKCFEVVMELQCLNCKDGGHVNLKPCLQHNK